MIDGIDSTIKSLDVNLQSFVHAYQVVSTFHSAIEEIISNSIDANSTDIKICINFDKLSFEVHDNGIGIVYENLISIGNWNQTSKSFHNKNSYGCKGEALSALKQISNELDIYTIPYGHNNNMLYHKHFSSTTSSTTSQMINSNDLHTDNNISILPNNSQVNNISDLDNNSLNILGVHGTIVKVTQLFHNLPVRRNIIKPEVELALIKEYVQRVAVLHHNIAWSVYCWSKKTSRYVRSLSLPMVSSVLHRLFTVHYNAATTLYHLEVIDFLSVGLLSPPLTSCCHWNKDYQYGYVNQRWLRNMDCISNYLNQCYNLVLASSVGMTARNFNTLEDIIYSDDSPTRIASVTTALNRHRFPCFVLQVTCDSHEYDVLVEPDKSTILFKKEAKLIRGLYHVVLQLFEKYLNESDLQLFIREEAKCYHTTDQEFIVRSSDINIGKNQRSSNNLQNSTENHPFQHFTCQLNDPLQHPQYLSNINGDNTHEVYELSMDNLTSINISPSAQSHLFSRAFFMNTPSSIPSKVNGSVTTALLRSLTPKLSRKDYFGDSPYSSPMWLLSAEEQQQYIANTPPTDSSLKNMIVDVLEVSRVGTKRSNLPLHGSSRKRYKPLAVLEEINNEYAVLKKEPYSSLTMLSFEPEVSAHVKKVSSININNDLLLSKIDGQQTSSSPIILSSNPLVQSYHYSMDENGNCTSPLQALQREDLEYIEVYGHDFKQHSSIDLETFKYTLDESVAKSCFDENQIKKSPPTQNDPDDDFIQKVYRKFESENKEKFESDYNKSNLIKSRSGSIPGLGCVMDQGTEISLNKTDLHEHLTLIGQADLRYILAHSESSESGSDVIIAFDQHAADERIRYEWYNNILRSSFQHEEFSNRSLDNIDPNMVPLKGVSVNYSMELNDKEYSIVHTKEKVFNTWAIFYQANVSNTPGSESEQFSLIVYMVPEIFGIRLVAADVREFFHYLICNELPDSLLRPPVISRILASKSCRGALKFGDLLNRIELEKLLKQLVICDFPFQCAHGRPSMVPIVDMTALYHLKINELLQCSVRNVYNF